jgi:putative component of membrane protein insertase Oxa1/YidC/SpoIIIJ protein YidD
VKAFPLVKSEWSITLVELLDHILSFYDRQVSDCAPRDCRFLVSCFTFFFLSAVAEEGCSHGEALPP